MTEEVLVRIRGLQALGTGDQDEVEVVTSGKYFQREGKHYVSYYEAVEGSEEKIHNLIKLGDETLEVTKKGLANIHMSFERDKKNLTYYETPYGRFLLGIAATNVDVRKREDAIDAEVRYALEINYEHIADCTLTMSVQSKAQSKLEFEEN